MTERTYDTASKVPIASPPMPSEGWMSTVSEINSSGQGVVATAHWD